MLLAAILSSAASGWTPRMLWEAWPEERFVTTEAPCLRSDVLEAGLRDLDARHADLQLEEVGRSFEDRPIFLLTVGHGPRKVLLWSQMHGDEPSATPALLDLADFLLRRADEPDARAILSELTLLIVPMLNPDGTEAYQRHNAQGIDINRDALNLATPEGRLLKRLRDEHEPMVGFNLHDQNRRITVGNTGVLATNSVLAVSGDLENTVTPGRLRAMRACSAIASALAPFAPGGMGRYDEDWSPRAFGDNLTAWGTPIVLIESGGLPAEREFSDLTRLNFVALLTVLRDLARDDLAAHDRQIYDELPRNRRGAWVDVAVRGGLLLQSGTIQPYRADLVFNIERGDGQLAECAPSLSGNSTGRSWIVEVGDAQFLASGQDIDASGHWIVAPLVVGVEGWSAQSWLDDKLLDRLARSGVGTVRWVVPPGRLEAATKQAREMAALGRARLEVSVEDTDLPTLKLDGPPPEPESDLLVDVLNVLGGTPSAMFAPGEPASFLLVAVNDDTTRGEAGGARLVSVWLDGRKVR